WDGHSWRQVPSPAPGVTSKLSAVSALSASSAWAVGTYLPAKGANRTLIEHWNGKAWTQVTGTPNPGGDSALTGVAAIAQNNVWAVGADGFGQSLTLHWD